MKKIIYYFSIVIFIFFHQSISLSQYQNVMISNLYSPNEVSIMINPKNTNQIVAGANIYYFGADTSLSGYYYSTNGGLNWSGGILHSTLASPSGDPVIIVDTVGYFYFIQNSNYHGFIPPCYDKHLVMKSTNGGASWPIGSTYGKNGDKLQDKPWGCVDWSNSIRRNNIYITWTEFTNYVSPGPFDSSIILFTKSSNGGLNWSQPLRISKRKGDARDSSNSMEGAVPCTGPNGEIYVSWSGPITLNNNQYGIFFNKSTDGGNTWLDSEIVATTQPGGWSFIISGVMRCNGFPVTCCDLSTGPNRGTIYVNFSDQRNGTTDTDIWLIKSTNGGLNWSPVKRVNNDSPGKHQFFNWMTIDQTTGYLYFVFYDQRNISNMSANVYVARSTNGGETFQNFRVNTNTINLFTNYFLGDYINISAANGHIRPIWTSTLNNGTIYTAIIDSINTGIKQISDVIPSAYSLKQNYPNPFNPITNVKFSVINSGNVKIEVYNIQGREVQTLVNERLNAGTYETTFDGSMLPSGVYFYKMITDGFSETKRMLMIK